MKKILFSLVLIGNLSAALALDVRVKTSLADNEINPFAADMLNATPAQMVRDNEFTKNKYNGNANALFFKDGDGLPENLLPPGMYEPYEPEVVPPTPPVPTPMPKPAPAPEVINPTIFDFLNDKYIRQDAYSLPGYLLDSRGPDVPGCVREECPVYALVDKRTQKLHLFLYGKEVDSWKVSSGLAGAHETPNFDQRPAGPVFSEYSSKKYPGGSYKGLGNMPYVVFIKGGFALHGTTEGNFKKLGTKASHGCIRQHSDKGYIFNRLVMKYGLENTWIKIIN